MTRVAAIALATLAAALVAACGGVEAAEGDRLFKAPTWTGAEAYAYRVETRGVDGAGTCTLRTTPEVEPGRTKLERACAKDEFRDDGTVVVESATLRPIESTRAAENLAKATRVVHSVAYGDGTARFATNDGNRTRATERDLPRPTDDHPEPGWYDDESLFWLARGLPLADGFEGTYVHVINAGQPRVLPVDVRVEGREQVKVPAGEFSAWKVRFERGKSVYFVWIESAAPARMVQARVEDTVYQLLK
jgi:hypothetical protein